MQVGWDLSLLVHLKQNHFCKWFQPQWIASLRMCSSPFHFYFSKEVWKTISNGCWLLSFTITLLIADLLFFGSKKFFGLCKLYHNVLLLLYDWTVKYIFISIILMNSWICYLLKQKRIPNSSESINKKIKSSS